MTCKHCGQPIHEIFCDPDMPYVHDNSHNCFCDVHTVNDVFSNKWRAIRTEAEPEEFEGEYFPHPAYSFSAN